MLATSNTLQTPDFIEEITVGQVLTLVVFIIAVVLLLNHVKKLLKPIQNFLDDWNGIEERPGVARQPGVMERLKLLEKMGVQTMHEVTPNSGKSMHDKVTQIKQAVMPDDEEGQKDVH